MKQGYHTMSSYYGMVAYKTTPIAFILSEFPQFMLLNRSFRTLKNYLSQLSLYQSRAMAKKFRKSALILLCKSESRQHCMGIGDK